MTRISILDHPFDTISPPELLQQIQLSIARKEQITIAFSNPEHVLSYLQNKSVKEYTDQCKYILPDGIGIIWASKILKNENNGVSLNQRITGTVFAYAISQACQEQKWRFCIFGGTIDSNTRAIVICQEVYPGIEILGIPGYGKSENEILLQLREYQPTVLMVCQGNPRQELWIQKNRRLLPNTYLIFGNGGAVDFISGTVKRAPLFFQRFHLEWLFRLTQDFTPQRFNRLLRIPMFVWMVLIRKLAKS